MGGLTLMDTRVALVTSNIVVPKMPVTAALIVLLPTLVETAKPWEVAALLTMAIAGMDELQVTKAVRSCLVLSE